MPLELRAEHGGLRRRQVPEELGAAQPLARLHECESVAHLRLVLHEGLQTAQLRQAGRRHEAAGRDSPVLSQLGELHDSVEPGKLERRFDLGDACGRMRHVGHEQRERDNGAIAVAVVQPCVFRLIGHRPAQHDEGHVEEGEVLHRHALLEVADERVHAVRPWTGEEPA